MTRANFNVTFIVILQSFGQFFYFMLTMMFICDGVWVETLILKQSLVLIIILISHIKIPLYNYTHASSGNIKANKWGSGVQSF